MTATQQQEADEADDKLILSESERIASVCSSFQGDLLSLIEENDRYRDDLDERAREIKKLNSELRRLKEKPLSNEGKDKGEDSLRLECAELQLINTMLKERLRRLDPLALESPLARTTPYDDRPASLLASPLPPGPALSGSPEPGPLSPVAPNALVSAQDSLRSQLNAKVAECARYEQELAKTHATAKDELQGAVDKVKAQCRRRIEELQKHFNAQTAALTEDCHAIKAMILDRETSRTDRTDAPGSAKDRDKDRDTDRDRDKDGRALQAEVDRLQQEVKVLRMARPGAEDSTAREGERPGDRERPPGDLVDGRLQTFLLDQGITPPDGSRSPDLLALAWAVLTDKAAAVDAKVHSLAEQKAALVAAKKELDVKAVKLNSKITAFNASVVKWNKKQQEQRDPPRRKDRERREEGTRPEREDRARAPETQS